MSIMKQLKQTGWIYFETLVDAIMERVFAVYSYPEPSPVLHRASASLAEKDCKCPPRAASVHERRPRAEPRRACAPRDAAPGCRDGTAAGHQVTEMTVALTSGDRYLSVSIEHLSARIEERARSAVSSLHPIQRP